MLYFRLSSKTWKSLQNFPFASQDLARNIDVYSLVRDPADANNDAVWGISCAI